MLVSAMQHAPLGPPLAEQQKLDLGVVPGPGQRLLKPEERAAIGRFEQAWDGVVAAADKVGPISHAVGNGLLSLSDYSSHQTKSSLLGLHKSPVERTILDVLSRDPKRTSSTSTDSPEYVEALGMLKSTRDAAVALPEADRQFQAALDDAWASYEALPPTLSRVRGEFTRKMLNDYAPAEPAHLRDSGYPYITNSVHESDRARGEFAYSQKQAGPVIGGYLDTWVKQLASSADGTREPAFPYAITRDGQPFTRDSGTLQVLSLLGNHYWGKGRAAVDIYNNNSGYSQYRNLHGALEGILQRGTISTD